MTYEQAQEQEAIAKRGIGRQYSDSQVRNLRLLAFQLG